MVILLLLLVCLLSVAVFVLFHHHMVNLNAWHTYLANDLVAVKNDAAAFKQWVATHLHLHTAPTAAPVASTTTKPA